MDVIFAAGFVNDYYKSFPNEHIFAKLSPSQPANPKLGAEIALLSQLWGVTIPTPTYPPTQNSGLNLLIT